MSRAQISRDSGLSKPTVSHSLAALERARLVRPAGRSTGGKGPSAILYELNPRAGWVVGIDVGTSLLRAAIADLNGDVVARRDERAQAASARTLGLVEALQRELGTNIAFENDVNLATVGEQWRGLGKDVSNFVYLHVGTGVGMGLVLNGELYRGATGAAGEVGYMPLAAADPHDPANRRRGALETALGAKGIVQMARELGMPPPLTSKKLLAAARRGDEKAREVVGHVAERIALAVAAVVPVVDPELVILGGGIGRNGDLLLEPVERELRAISPFQPRLEVSALGEDAELTGAVALALQTAQDLLFSRGRVAVAT